MLFIPAGGWVRGSSPKFVRCKGACGLGTRLGVAVMPGTSACHSICKCEKRRSPVRTKTHSTQCFIYDRDGCAERRFYTQIGGIEQVRVLGGLHRACRSLGVAPVSFHNIIKDL